MELPDDLKEARLTVTRAAELADMHPTQGLRQLNFPKKDLTPRKLNAALAAISGKERPDLGEAIPAIARRL